MSLLRVPCVLIATVGFHIGTTPPNPPPKANERAPTTKWEGILPMRFSITVLQILVWGVAIMESAVIVASKFPSLLISQCILSTVMCNNPKDLHFTSASAIGTFLAAWGGLVRWQCYRALGRLFTVEMSVRKDHKLITSGPYAVVRHPSYTGLFITFVGIILGHGTPGSWLQESGALNTVIGKGALGCFLVILAGSFVLLMSRMPKEDEAMKREFGRDWVEWAERVPYKLIPGVY